MADSQTTTSAIVHTPGPWRLGSPTSVQHDYPKRYTSESVSIHSLNRSCIATVYAGCEGGSVGRPFVDIEAGRANAKLIASAPELLEACRLFTEAAHEVRDILNGKGYPCPASIAFAAERARNAIAKVEGEQ